MKTAIKEQAKPKRLTDKQMRELLLSLKKEADKMPEEEDSFGVEMETYFEHLINAVYHAYQDILIKKHGKEKIGNLTIYTKKIHLNILFAYCLAGLRSDIPNFTELFSFRKLINTIAHELAHCLMANYKLKFGQKHDQRHQELTQDVEAFFQEIASREYTQKEIDAMIYLTKQEAKTWQERMKKAQLFLELAERESKEAEKLRIKETAHWLSQQFKQYHE
ncbi:16470_t:CDS:2 [Entrophospora sp. SA101]|nr:16470_t:CDS:2 [Entrophospora sp. SA101]